DAPAGKKSSWRRLVGEREPRDVGEVSIACRGPRSHSGRRPASRSSSLSGVSVTAKPPRVQKLGRADPSTIRHAVADARLTAVTDAPPSSNNEEQVAKLARSRVAANGPPGRGAVGRDQCFSGEHPVGLFAGQDPP